MKTSESSDAQFLRRWQRWHRLGWPIYLLSSLIGTAIVAAITILFVRIIIEHIVEFSAPHRPILVEYACVAGAVFGSVTKFLAQFTENETRYEHLTRSSDKAA